MPSVIGLGYFNAEAQVRAAGFIPEKSTYKTCDSFTAEEVTDQRPDRWHPGQSGDTVRPLVAVRQRPHLCTNDQD